LTPSVFVRARRKGDVAGQGVGASAGGAPQEVAPRGVLDPRELFICPSCAGSRWQVSEREMHCLDCDTRWEIDDGIYDFKNPRHA
jgi:hypothetical protein